jgi:hypothetical protein
MEERLGADVEQELFLAEQQGQLIQREIRNSQSTSRLTRFPDQSLYQL